MKKRYFSTIFAAIFLLMMTSCVREQFAPGGLTGGEGYIYLKFGAAPNVEVSTKATLNAESENRIMNLYVFVFDEAGHKIHGKWYSELDRTNSEGELDIIEEGWWYSQANQPSTGVIKIKSPSGSGFKIYVFANIDGDMVKISSEMLSHNINTEDDIKNFQVYLNQETTSRNGYFPMSGSISGVTVDKDKGITIEGSGSLSLQRMDAKIKFTFQAGKRPDENGQVIQSFEPKSWRVFNIPKTAFLMERNEDACSVDPNTPTGDYSQYASLFFDSEWANFEEFPEPNKASFSFYMPENRQTPKNSSFTSYQDRSRQKKTATGLNEVQAVEYTSLSGKTSTKSMRIFQNANDFSTYVLVSARVTMKLTGNEAGQTLGGDVLYLIHLGDWKSKKIHNGDSEHWNDDEYEDVANFRTERNTSYNYTVTVNSVNNIRIEVETSDGENIENQPGASGQITIAKEEIAICDAHYETKTMTFSAKNFFEGTTATVDDLTWRVKTPFGEGSPAIGQDGADIPAGLDYKWVHFRLNKKDAKGEFYLDKRRRYTNRVFAESSTFRTAEENEESDGSGDGLGGYHNDGVMDIIDMVKYIKTQVKRYASWLENGGNYTDYKCDFDSKELDKAKICVTVFVDEYYYDKDPISGGSSPTLWKRFVNKEERAMHILCNSNTSKDLESRATGSVITIQQKPIKSIYNTDESYTRLQNAWGLESTDEYANKVFTYNQDGSRDGSGKNTDDHNGLANSVFEWGLAPEGTTVSNITTIQDNVRWDKYLSFEEENKVPQLKDGYKSLRYICMSRNRDNNGNGIIDRDEVRWYLASVRQLIGMYVGDGVLESSVRIYNRSTADRKLDDPARWRQHVISSTKYPGSKQPTVIWGEEGISTGNISGSFDWGGITNFTVRCVRNLGLANDAPIYETPDDYIQTSQNADGSYTFECTHINESALRYYTSRELDYEDERATANSLYKKFETAPADQTWTSGAVSFKALNDEVSKYGSSVYTWYCPDGYRLPSQTELAVMRYYTNLVSSGYYPSRTFWSLGVEAKVWGDKGKDGKNKYGFCTSDGNISLSENATFSKARCVRDIRVE